MARDEQIDRVVRAIELGVQVLASALGGIEDAIRQGGGKPPSSRPSTKTKVGGI